MAADPRVRRVQEIRRSNAAQPVPSGRTYRRRPKHRDRPEHERQTYREDTDR